MSDFAFSHVLWNQNFEVVSSSHSNHIHSESKLLWKRKNACADIILYQLLKVKFELWLQILSHFHALGRFRFPKLLWSFRVNIQWKWQTLAIDVKCIPHHIHERKLHIYKKSIPHLWKSIQKIIWGHAFFSFFLDSLDNEWT